MLGAPMATDHTQGIINGSQQTPKASTLTSSEVPRTTDEELTGHVTGMQQAEAQSVTPLPGAISTAGDLKSLQIKAIQRDVRDQSLPDTMGKGE